MTKTRISPSGRAIDVPEALTNVVVVESESDLPLVGGVHRLASGILYRANTIIPITLPFVFEPGSQLTGDNAFHDGFSYSGASPMIQTVGSGGLDLIQNLLMNSSSAPLFDIGNGNVPDNFAINGFIGSCPEVGDIEVNNSLVILNAAFAGHDKGLLLKGTPERVALDLFSFTQDAAATGTCIDYGDATLSSLRVLNGRFVTAAGGFALDGLLSSGNVPAGDGIVTSNEFNGIGAVFKPASGPSGLTLDDLRYLYQTNFGLAPSQIIGSYVMQGNAVATVISGIGAWVKVAGTTVAASERRMTMSGNNELTLDQPLLSGDIDLGVSFSATGEVAGGAGKECEFALAFEPAGGGGFVVDDDTRRAIELSNTAIEASLTWEVSLGTGAKAQLMVRNQVDTNNITVTSMNVLFKDWP